MGNFYANYTVRTETPQGVASVLAGRDAIVTPAQNGCVVVYDEESESQSIGIIAEVGRLLSEKLRCVVLAVMNHDDDILYYQLFENGQLADEYNSDPEYFEPEAELGAQGGDASELCEAFDTDDVLGVERVLRKSSLDEDGFAFAVERHAELVRLLGLPEYSVGFGYAYISRGELPDGLTESMF